MEHFLSAPLYIQIHASAAMLALLLGPVAIYRKRRDIWHKTVGYTWIIAMLTVAISSFWIHSFGVIGPFSPIHLLSIWTFYTVVKSIQMAREGKIKAHQNMLRWLYWGGLWVAFALNFLPGRMTHRIVLGSDQAELSFVLIVLIIAMGLLIASRWGRVRRRFMRT